MTPTPATTPRYAATVARKARERAREQTKAAVLDELAEAIHRHAHGEPMPSFPRAADPGNRGHSTHCTDELVGYVVSESMHDGRVVNDHGGRWVALVREGTNYGEAIALFSAIRRIPGSYAVALSVYSCGCVG